MGSKSIKEHVKKYICAVFKDRLIAEGFRSDNDINWYRVINDEVIHGIYFYSSYSMLPAVLNIGYGCHPMCITPHISGNPYLYGLPGDEVIYPGKLNVKAYNKTFSCDAQVMCPADEYAGLDLLELVLSEINKCQTALDCYTLHKQWKADQIKNQKFLIVSPYFINEVLYFQDEALYPMCKNWIRERTALLRAAQEKSTLWKGHKEELRELELLEQTMLQGKIEEHLQLLKQREVQNRRKINGIVNQ